MYNDELLNMLSALNAMYCNHIIIDIIWNRCKVRVMKTSYGVTENSKVKHENLTPVNPGMYSGIFSRAQYFPPIISDSEACNRTVIQRKYTFVYMTILSALTFL